MLMQASLLRASLLCWAALGQVLGAGIPSAAAAGSAPPVAVAVVTDLTGQGQLRRSGQQRTLAVLDSLQPQDQLRLDSGATAEIAFTAGTGSVLRLVGPGRFLVREQDVLPRDAGATAERRDLAAAWRNVQIRPALIGRASYSMRGLAATQVRLRFPIGGQGADGPVKLAWDQPYGRLAGNWDYAVRVIDDQGQLVFATQAQDRVVALPASLDLARGRDYLWTVQAQAGDRRHAYGAAEFHLIAADVDQRIRVLTQSVVESRRDSAQAESSAEEVLLAVAMEQAGLRDAAQRQWQALAPLRPVLTGRIAARP